MFVPQSERDVRSCEGSEWTFGNLGSGARAGSPNVASLTKPSRDSSREDGGTDTPALVTPTGQRGHVPPKGSLQRASKSRSSGNSGGNSGGRGARPVKSLSMIPMPPLQLVSRTAWEVSAGASSDAEGAQRASDVCSTTTLLDQTSLAFLLENHVVATLCSDDMRRGADTFADWREGLRRARGDGPSLDLPACSCLIRSPDGSPLVFVMSANWAAEFMLVGYAEALARTLTAARASAANERARAKAQLRDHRSFLVRGTRLHRSCSRSWKRSVRGCVAERTPSPNPLRLAGDDVPRGEPSLGRLIHWLVAVR